MPRTTAPRNVNAVFTGLMPAGIWTTQEVVALAGGLPVGGTAGGQIRTLARIIVPVDAGDVLEVSGRQRVTNDIGPNRYTVGVGHWFDTYDVDDGVAYADKLWTRYGSLNGTNVDRSIIHHVALHLEDVWRIPAGWPVGRSDIGSRWRTAPTRIRPPGTTTAGATRSPSTTTAC